MLKAKSPIKTEKRLKLFLYGPAGIGKTTAAIQFPHSYIIDTERGTGAYANTINTSGSVVLQTNNIDEIRDELKALLTEKHGYKTLIIDPVTQIYNQVQEKWNRIFERNSKTKSELEDYGMRYWARVKSDFKSIQRLILQLDMNVIVTAHQKDQYGNGMTKIGVTFDSMKGDDYLFDYIFHLQMRDGQRKAVTMKERAEIGQQKFPQDFEWSYANFLKFYGHDIIEREAVPVAMATPEQVLAVIDLLSRVKVDEDWEQKVFTKADVDKWDEMNADQITKAIDFLQKRIK